MSSNSKNPAVAIEEAFGLATAASPEARAAADDLTFEALARACIHLAELAEVGWEAASRRDARSAALSLKQAIATLRAACEVVAMLGDAP